MEGNKSHRMVQMIELMSRPGGIRAHDLMELFSVDPRTLRRYLVDLRDMRVPVVDIGRGNARVLSVDPRWRRTGVQLSLAEVLSLHFGRRLFNFLDGTSFVSDMDGAIERLHPAISRTHAELSRQLDGKFMAVPEHAKDYRGEVSEIIDDLITAVVYNNPVDIRYRRLDELTRHYSLHPYTIAVYRQGLYVLALDVEAGQVKTFAVERIAEIARRMREKFVVPEGWDPQAHLRHAFGIFSGSPQHVEVAFSPDVRTLVRERRWHATQSLQQLADGWTLLTMDVAVTVELVSWILSFGRDARVYGPATLRQVVAEQARAMVAAYAEPPPAVIEARA